MLAQLLEILVGGHVGHLRRRLGKPKRRALGIGKQIAGLEFPHRQNLFVGDTGTGDVAAGMGDAIHAAGALRRHVADQVLELEGDRAFFLLIDRFSEIDEGAQQVGLVRHDELGIRNKAHAFDHGFEHVLQLGNVFEIKRFDTAHRFLLDRVPGPAPDCRGAFGSRIKRKSPAD